MEHILTHKVGDYVQVRFWNDMRKEFGYNTDDNINVKFVFTREMGKYCGKWATITKIAPSRFHKQSHYVLFFEEFGLSHRASNYSFCDGMLVDPKRITLTKKILGNMEFDDALL